MEIIRNEKLIKRNGAIGQITSVGGLLLLLGSLVIVWVKEEYFLYAWIAMLVGFLLSQVGLFFGARYGKRPRPDEKLDEAFKGLDDRFTLYHYSSPVSHLLIGPAGIWVLLPRSLSGKITYSKGRWRNQVKGVWRNYLRIFAQEGIGRPDLELKTDVETVTSFLKKKLPDTELPQVQGAFVILNESVDIEAEEAPYLTVTAKKLKEAVRKSAKLQGLSATRLDAVNQAFGTER